MDDRVHKHEDGIATRARRLPAVALARDEKLMNKTKRKDLDSIQPGSTIVSELLAAAEVMGLARILSKRRTVRLR